MRQPRKRPANFHPCIVEFVALLVVTVAFLYVGALWASTEDEYTKHIPAKELP